MPSSREKAHQTTTNSTRLSRLALAAALVVAPASFSKPAFAQDARVRASETYAQGNTVEQGTFLRALGSHPVLDAGHPRMTREIANASVQALGTRVDTENAGVLVETLSYLGTQSRGGALAQELSAAGVERTTGDSLWVDITDEVESLRDGQQVTAGSRIEVRRTAVDSRRVIPGMTTRSGEQVNFDARTFRIGGNRSTGESTTALEIRMIDADGSSQLVGYFDDCGNITTWEEAAPVATQALEAAPCVQIRVRPPRDVNFTNERVQARVVMLDLGRGGTLPVEQCLSEEQVQVNCEGPCSDMMLDAAQRSAPYREALQRTMRERGNNATISRIYSPDADYTPDAEGGYITLPVRADQVNENVVFIVCFDWENGGSSVITITEPVAGQNGVLEDQLVMNGAGQNMTVFRGGRRVSRPARQ